jgi:hypothetical protein
METLIELIVWIFKAILGDEKSADMSGRTPPTRGPARRGPYNYGDESSSRRPKTLEEILEEVRREASQKRGGAPARPAAPPPPAATARVEQRTLRTKMDVDPPLSQSLSVPSADTGRPLGRLEGASTLPTLPHMSRQVPPPGAPAYRPPMAELISPQEAAAALAVTAATPQAVDTVSEMKALSAPVRVAATVTGVALIAAMRRGSPQSRRDAARQAVLLSEIFGPPRGRRPMRRVI